MPARNRLSGLLIMLCAVAAFSFMDAGIKLLSAHHPPLQVAALRGASSLPLVLAWIGATGGFRALLQVRWPLHLFRGALAVMMMGTFSYALRTLPLSTAYTLFFVAPLMITALSAPVLGEEVGRRRWIAIIIGFVGTLVVFRPDGSGMLTLSGLAILVCAVGYAASALTVRVLHRTDSTQSMVFWLLSLLSLGAGLLALPDWQPLDRKDWFVVAGVGVCGALGQYAITEAFARAEASVLAPLEYTALAWGIALDLLLWGNLPDRVTLLGAAIIVASGLYLIRHESSRRDEPGVVPP